MSAHRVLDRAYTTYRIGDPNGRYPIFSSEGAYQNAGRWHLAGDRVIYVSENYSTAMLEKLVYYNAAMPPGQHFARITLPAGLSYEVFSPASVPNWASANKREAQAFGHTWIEAQRSCLLFMPSVVAREERNVLINERHPDFSRITLGLEEPIWWDARLFA